MSEQEDASLVGYKVVTLHDAGGDTWVDKTRSKCKWGEPGIITDYSNSHGLCYEVVHLDGTAAWYDPEELEVLD